MKKVLDKTIDFFPPSKNRLYYGSAIKKIFINQLLDIPEFKKFREMVRLQDKEYAVIVRFKVGDTKYKRFEVQNFLEVLLDAIFGEYQDHKIVKLCASKEAGNNKAEIEIYEI